MTHHVMEKFEQNGHTINVSVDDDGSIWFLGNDLARAFGHANSSDAFRGIPDRHLSRMWINTGGGRQEATIINEPGFYRFVMRSNKPEAEPFQQWVTEEVLPTIRRTGAYMAKPLTRVELARQILQAEERMERQAKIAKAITPSAAGWDNLVKPQTLNGDWSLKYCAQKLSAAGVDINEEGLRIHLARSGFTVFNNVEARFEPSKPSRRAGLVTGEVDQVSGEYQVRLTPKGLSVVYVALGGHPDIPEELLAISA